MYPSPDGQKDPLMDRIRQSDSLWVVVGEFAEQTSAARLPRERHAAVTVEVPDSPTAGKLPWSRLWQKAPEK
jgi:hypothetical protein